jgi:hypothetical protein
VQFKRLRKRTAPPPQKTDELYRQLYRAVDGAVLDAFVHHPEYLAPGVNQRVVQRSIAKRVAGATASLLKSKGRR